MPLSPKSIDRRDFLRAAAGAVGASAILPACDPSEETVSPGLEEVFFQDDFGSAGAGWGNRWLSFRPEAALERAGGAGVMSFPPAVKRAVTGETDQMEYMVQPVVVKDLQGSDVDVRATVELEGDVEAGLIVRASFDESYALLVTRAEALLCRYGVTDRVVLDRASLRGSGARGLRLVAAGDRVTGEVTAGGTEVLVEVRDASPPKEGLVGALANPLDEEASTKALFTAFSARGSGTRWRTERLLYRFAGAVVPSGDTFRARVTARTEVPTPIAFEIATDESFETSTRTDFLEPAGELGSVHGWLEGLQGDRAYFWRPIFRSLDEEVAGPPASLRTPPPAGAPVRFVFASCTSGRVAAYPSFSRAAELGPSFYVHAGDWGYADLTAVVRSGDHFQARWIRLLRAPETSELLAVAPLLFWQDDHDYQADNGWAQTVQPYAVRAFDELHANPTDEYFDIRWGDAHVFCLDCRLYASDPEAPDGPEKSRIGDAQKAWLKRAMSESDAPLLVVASAMAFRDKVDDDPGWHNVYTTERDELLAFLAGLDATVVILSGDSHGQRLIHHFEFGELYEITSSGTDFPGGSQGRNDPEHTQIYSPENGIALVELDPEGPGRSVTVSVVATEDGSHILQKSLRIP